MRFRRATGGRSGFDAETCAWSSSSCCVPGRNLAVRGYASISAIGNRVTAVTRQQRRSENMKRGVIGCRNCEGGIDLDNEAVLRSSQPEARTRPNG